LRKLAAKRRLKMAKSTPIIPHRLKRTFNLKIFGEKA